MTKARPVAAKGLNAALIAVALIPLTAQAQREGIVNGAGTEGCGRFLELRGNADAERAIAQWVMGFVSSYNLFATRPQIARPPDQSTIVAYLDKHCRENPLDDIAKASIVLIGDLGGWRRPAPKR